MAKIPTPEQLHRRLERVKLLVERMDIEYRWLHEAAHGGSSGILGARRGGLSRPTEGTALDPRRQRARDDLRVVEGHVKTMIDSLGNAVKTLRRHDDLNRVILADPIGQVATPDEVEESRDAKARREARGEGWGAA